MRQDAQFPNLFIIDHPLIQHKLSLMRDKSTSSKDFRTLLREITMLMGYEVTRNLPTTTRTIETPLCTCDAPFIAGRKAVLVPVLRAGLGMVDGMVDLMPSVRIGHIGLYRDENHHPVEYLVKMPDVEGRQFFVLDPMVATGESAAHAVEVLRKRGVAAKDITFISLLCAPEGIETFARIHPDVRVYTASLDERLNEKAYILPGLGDAGDRLFGTF